MKHSELLFVVWAFLALFILAMVGMLQGFDQRSMMVVRCFLVLFLLSGGMLVWALRRLAR